MSRGGQWPENKPESIQHPSLVGPRGGDRGHFPPQVCGSLLHTQGPLLTWRPKWHLPLPGDATCAVLHGVDGSMPGADYMSASYLGMGVPEAAGPGLLPLGEPGPQAVDLGRTVGVWGEEVWQSPRQASSGELD